MKIKLLSGVCLGQDPETRESVTGQPGDIVDLDDIAGILTGGEVGRTPEKFGKWLIEVGKAEPYPTGLRKVLGR